ncbi:helix-turn-helix domain-containing protein [Halegenticoccus soli]|uniref:helix-turn-helix domain-containing protein n=1 Tax=Halegenticoccus soli TaxID=1985678 RepID=UPI000C6DA8E7|nr:helix-turn-helix domain-containing protein [Halegenticoccus soli]
MSSVIAEVQVSGPGAVLTQHALPKLPEARIAVQYQASPDSAGFVVENCDFDAFERELRADPSVADFERIVDFPAVRVYNVRARTDTPLVSKLLADRGIQVLTATSRPGEATWRLRVRSPDRASLSSFLAHCEENGISVRIDKLYSEAYPFERSGSAGDGANLLTDKQREALELAFSAGYFDIPRKCTVDGLSEEIGVSQQAVSERIRRGVKSLLELHLPHEH